MSGAKGVVQLGPLRRTGGPLNHAVYDLLKERLLEGHYAAGTRLPTDDLRLQLGVSKQPVMEALRRLDAISVQIDALRVEPDAAVRSRGYRLWNRRFHHAIGAMAQSRVMTETSRRMWDLSDFLINTAGVPQPLSSALDHRHADHERIRAALHAGDHAAAREEMERHIVTTAAVIQAETDSARRSG